MSTDWIIAFVSAGMFVAGVLVGAAARSVRAQKDLRRYRAASFRLARAHESAARQITLLEMNRAQRRAVIARRHRGGR